MEAGQSPTKDSCAALQQDTLSEHTISEYTITETATRQDISVEIFVSEHCFVCDYAHEVAATIQRDFPAVKLRVIDIHHTEEQIPERVFATPTYLLNGKVWSLGNPSPQKVTETLSALLD